MQTVFARMSEADRAIFTIRHRRALEKACAEIKWGHHQVRIQWSIPTFLGRYYVIALSGRERRSAERRFHEERRYPFARIGNLLFLGLLSIVAVFLIVSLGAMFFIGYNQLFNS